jgi:hypothetical protein
MKFRRGDLVTRPADTGDCGIVCETAAGYTKVYFLADLATEWMLSDALILARGSNPSIEADTAPVGASSDSERLDMSVDASTPSAEREAL